MKAPDEKMECPVCHLPARKTVDHEVYPNKMFTEGRVMWVCPNFPRCDTFAASHPNGKSKGPMTSKPTRIAKIRAHAAFDRLWTEGIMRRSQAYQFLAEHLGVKEAHIAWMNIDECKATERWAVDTYCTILMDWESRYGPERTYERIQQYLKINPKRRTL